MRTDKDYQSREGRILGGADAIPRASQLPLIWVLNLKRSTERRRYIVQHLRELGLEFELVEAIDGHALSAETLGTMCDQALARRMLSRELTRSEIGCALTHLRLYQRMLDEAVPLALILEDDVTIDPACVELLRLQERFPSDWELILFFHNGGQPSFWGRWRLDRAHWMVRFATHAWGAGGYLLKNSAARKLLRIAYPIHVPADALTGGGIPNGILSYGVIPAPIVPLPSWRAPSTMQEAHAFRAPAITPALGWARFALYSARMGIYSTIHKYRPLLPQRAFESVGWGSGDGGPAGVPDE